MLRGNGGRDIFFDEPDLIRFYDLLEEGVKRFDVRIPALCLLSNHVHLVVKVAEIPLSRLISMEDIITHVCKRYGLEPTAVA